MQLWGGGGLTPLTPPPLSRTLHAPLDPQKWVLHVTPQTLCSRYSGCARPRPPLLDPPGVGATNYRTTQPYRQDAILPEIGPSCHRL